MAIFQKQKKESKNVEPVAEGVSRTKNDSQSKMVFGPRITEKATGLTARSRIYSFNVSPHANKRLVKEAVESLHKVDITSVHMVSIPRKRRMRGRLEGWKKGYKKALVRVKEGQTIEIAEEVKKK